MQSSLVGLPNACLMCIKDWFQFSCNACFRLLLSKTEVRVRETDKLLKVHYTV